MADALKSLEDQYNLLTTNWDKLKAACKSDADLSALTTQYMACRRNYWDCINKTFQEDDSSVQKLVNDMKQHQAAIQAALTDLGSIAGVINTITTAVQTGAELASKV